MRTYILRRLLEIVPTVLMITLVVFVMMRSVPGDPVVSLLGDAFTEEDAVKARQEYGLDKPILVQYVIWLGKLVQGDWGTSILSGRPVLKDVLIRLPVTLELIVLSMAVALVIAIPAAIIGALRQNTWADYTATIGRHDRGLDPRVLHRRPAAAGLLHRRWAASFPARDGCTCRARARPCCAA